MNRLISTKDVDQTRLPHPMIFGEHAVLHNRLHMFTYIYILNVDVQSLQSSVIFSLRSDDEFRRPKEQ